MVEPASDRAHTIKNDELASGDDGMGMDVDRPHPPPSTLVPQHSHMHQRVVAAETWIPSFVITIAAPG
jgi:hypothetical protein